ncbi:MAG TPA: bifunctional phosphopantothenoylcysteine decarboxylase/phosphopantothenate--cysteine ligase CoaBC [Eggerthellaceae bacterium]|nr:bifunctional phosphopantothenoylcysteine decarboxylase/phosphopantothenate--cysteine ligase CoaBC [Eggerthellaceae bacterium]
MGKTVLIGITGCVALYKACELVRILQKGGFRCKVVMTESATRFIDPLMFRSLTREPVAVGLFDDDPGDPIHHISLAKEADVFAIAPCTANVMAKLACGIADDLLTTTALATTAPIVVAPAMNANMYEHEATQANMRLLRARGVRIVEADAGYLACGDEGRGRLADPQVIADEIRAAMSVRADLKGAKVLITTGPTVERIDPVRFISNPSSGKTGFALAQAALERGAEVSLVTGPVHLDDVEGAETVRVESARDMLQAVDARFDACDIAIFSAAVSDFRPDRESGRKLKKGTDDQALRCLRLVENPDILATMAARKAKGQVVVGFAAETEDAEENARRKLMRKGADFIVANIVAEGRGFGADDNEVSLVSRESSKHYPTMSKRQLADLVLDHALAMRDGGAL